MDWIKRSDTEPPKEGKIYIWGPEYRLPRDALWNDERKLWEDGVVLEDETKREAIFDLWSSQKNFEFLAINLFRKQLCMDKENQNFCVYCRRIQNGLD